jgi:hypothetical protein
MFQVTAAAQASFTQLRSGSLFSTRADVWFVSNAPNEAALNLGSSGGFSFPAIQAVVIS